MGGRPQHAKCLMRKRASRFTAALRAATIVGYLWLSCATVLSQQRIDGTVISKPSRTPIAGATVKVESGFSSSLHEATTDAHGRFSFMTLSPGRYTVSVTAERFYTEQITLVLPPRAAQQLDFELTPVALIREEMIVTAQTKLLDKTQTAIATTITIDQISRLPAARRASLADTITPYISSAIAGHDNLTHARGNELSLNVFLNGVSFFDSPSQLFTPGLAPDVIQSVNIITGGFPAEFGNRFGGVLDVVTRTGFEADNHGSVLLSAGDALRHTVAFDYGGHSQRFGYFLYAQGFQSNRFLNTPEPASLHNFGRGVHSFVQLDYRPGSHDTFRLVLSGSGTNFELPNTANDEYYGRDAFQRNREQTAILSWEHFFSTASALSTSIYQRYVSTRLVPTTDPFSILASGLRNNITLGAKSDYSLHKGSRHAIKVGIDLMLLRLREDFFFDPREDGPAGLASITSVAAPQHGSGTPPKFRLRARNTGGQASGYIQDQIRLFKRLTANIGVRYDQYSLLTSDHVLSPRLNFAYAWPGEHTVFHVAYNRFFSPPPIENLLLSSFLGLAGQPPQAARSHHFETGVSRSIRDKLYLRATAYWRSDKNSFETIELADVRLFAPTTFARGKAYGAEISSELPEIKPLGLSGYFSYTAQRAFQQGPITGGFPLGHERESNEELPAAFDQIHSFVAELVWRERRSGFWSSVMFNYGSGTPLDTKTETGSDVLIRLPDHFVIHLSFGIELFRRERRSLSLQFNIENVSNEVYQIAKASVFSPVQYSPPRFFSGSLKIRF